MISNLLAGGAIPNPTPTAPPGADQFMLILNWGMWICIVFGGLGLVISVGLVFTGVMDGRATQGFKAFMIVCIGLLLLGLVGQFINAFL